MKRVMCLALGMCLLAPAAYAQGGGGGQPVGIADGLRAAYNRIKNLVTLSADKLSEADYSFRPVNEIRNYGQLWAHVANFHYGTCAQVKGVPNPNQGINLENTLMTKAEFVKALADSYAFCDDAFASLTDQSAVELLMGGRGGPRARLVVMNQIVEHDNEMYGIGTVYQRLKGVVPPSTEAQQNRGGGAGRQGGGGGGRGN